jgi:hypothetical protein
LVQVGLLSVVWLPSLDSRAEQGSVRWPPEPAEHHTQAPPDAIHDPRLLDAISAVTDTVTPFDGLPKGARATQIPDGRTENPFLKTFGRPARELACECERESDSNLSQALQLIGGATVNGKLRDDKGRMASLARSDRSPEEVTKELYLVALAREPNASELSAAVKHLTAAPDRRQAVEDLGWVLINSKEFLFRH